MLTKFLLPAFLLCSLPLLSACGGRVMHHGYIHQTHKLAEIKTGHTSKSDVKTILGTPTTESQPDKKIWYYVSKKDKHFAFLTPDRVEDQIIKVEFDRNDIVANVEKKHFNKNSIDTVPEKTPTQGNDISVFEQLLGNIGRFNTKTRPGQ